MSKSLVGPWAADKLDRLRKYLHAYTTIMRRQVRWCKGYYYIDAFAGPGLHELRPASTRQSFTSQVLLEAAKFVRQPEHRRFLAGSPRVALELEHPFTRYVFVEKNPRRVAELEKLEREFAHRCKVVIRQEDCNRYLLERVVANDAVDWKRHRAVVFLDPFGMQVEWPTLAALGSTQAIEVILNFPVGMAIQRLLRRKPEEFTKAQRAKLDAYLGSPDWYDVLYRSDKTLFGVTKTKIENSGKALLKWYQARLKGVFGHVSKAALIRNTRGAHLYYLLVASPNRTGIRIANDILSAGEVV